MIIKTTKNLLLFFFLLMTIKTMKITSAEVKKWSLNPSEQERVEKGELVLQTSDSPHFVWPVVEVFGLIQNVRPIESLAIYADYLNQKNYVPQMIKSQVEEELSPLSILVSYSMKMPWPVPNTHYKTINTMTFDRQHKAYQLEWKQTESNQTKSSDGFIIFYPHPNQRDTLFLYQNFIVPDSALAKWFKEKFLSDTLQTLKVILDHIKETKKSSPQEMQDKVKMVQQMFDGKSVYLPIIEAGKNNKQITK